MGLLSGLMSMLGWGTADFLAAVSSRKFGNFLTYFWMQLVGFLLASIYFMLNLSSFSWNSVPKLILVLLGVAIFQVLAYLSFYNGLETGLVSIVSPLGATFAAVTAMLSMVFYKEHLTNLQLLAILIVILSVILVSIDFTELKSTKKLSIISGVTQGLQASLGWGISLFLLVKAANTLGWFLPVYIFRFLAILLLLLLALITKKSLKIRGTRRNFLLLIPVGVLDISAFFSYSLGVISTYASIVATISSAFAVITVLLAFLFLKERLKNTQIVGVLGVILGIMLLSI